MFEPKCGNCGYDVDPNRNYKCPKCGYKFWRSREFFDKNLIKLPPLEKKSVDVEMKTKEIKKKIPFNFGITSYRFSHFIAKSLILGVLAFVLTFGALKIYDQRMAEIIANDIWIALLGLWAILIVGYLYGITNSETGTKTRKNNIQLGKIHCPKCGKKIDDDSKYCIYCGSKV